MRVWPPINQGALPRQQICQRLDLGHLILQSCDKFVLFVSHPIYGVLTAQVDESITLYLALFASNSSPGELPGKPLEAAGLPPGPLLPPAVPFPACGLPPRPGPPSPPAASLPGPPPPSPPAASLPASCRLPP